MTIATKINHQIRRYLSQAGLERLKHIPTETCIWKCHESNPLKHTSAHEGLFYLLPEGQQLPAIYGERSPYIPKLEKYYKALGLLPLMIRKPALTAFDYITRIEDQKPNVRILFYGDLGRGKTHTLVHMLHYLHAKQDHIIINIRYMLWFTRHPRDFSDSISRPGRMDTPTDAAELLQHFRTQNAQLLSKYEDVLRASQDYTWSLREITKAGEPLINIVDHGINRINHASDCVAVLIKELMLAADQGKIKLATVLDDVNLLFLREVFEEYRSDRKKILIDELTCSRALKKLIKSNYKNGLLLATCDDRISVKQNRTPQEAFGQQGWDYFDPFLPIEVPTYSRKEFESCMNMYQSIGWLCRPESRTQEVRDQVRFVSGLNPGEVQRLCQPL